MLIGGPLINLKGCRIVCQRGRRQLYCHRTHVFFQGAIHPCRIGFVKEDATLSAGQGLPGVVRSLQVLSSHVDVSQTLFDKVKDQRGFGSAEAQGSPGENYGPDLFMADEVSPRVDGFQVEWI